MRVRMVSADRTRRTIIPHPLHRQTTHPIIPHPVPPPLPHPPIAGFLGQQLLPRILSRGNDVTVLVQPKFVDAALKSIAQLPAGQRPRVHIAEGDITLADLGLDEAERSALTGAVTEIYHLAAVYDLSVGKDLAQRVNIGGTRHVLAMAQECKQLRRLHYVSTCYVSGDATGVFLESDLQKGQGFNNWYESSKMEAEVLVQACMGQGLPTTIYRPAIVMGNSRTGATQKFDGPYMFLRFLLRQPFGPLGFLPLAWGNQRQRYVHCVPSDFVVDAMDALGQRPGSEGKIYHLCNPVPVTLESFVVAMEKGTGKKVICLPSPLWLLRLLFRIIPFIERITGLPRAVVPYMDHRCMYGVDNLVADLQGTGVTCPPLNMYIKSAAEFVKANPKISSKGMS
eukprot:jgi/Mesvir1/17817/Mv12913-RA.1